MRLVWTLALLALLASAALAGPPITLESLLDEMVDRARLARWPDPAYTCRQASSYDRASVSPDDEGWYANWDRSHFVRTEERDGRTEHVLMDAEGPGALVRFWATWHGPRGQPFSNGTLRVYLDGGAAPAIEGPIADVIDGGLLAGPPLSQGVSPLTDHARRGHNLYLPIPYAKRCKVTYATPAFIDTGGKTGEALYYQINYRTYEKGTEVETFRRDRLAALAPKLARLQHRLALSGPTEEAGLPSAALDGPIAPGESRSVTITGPAAIRELTVALRADDLPQALRSTVLEIAFDGRRTVWCPVGDFFGIGYQFRQYRTWYTQVLTDGSMSAYWVMPFAESCRLTLHNLADTPVTVTLGRARYSPWQWDDRSMHFHATWRQYTKAATGIRKTQEKRDGARDVNYVAVTGRGVYVGDTLVLFNGADGWWGEGDEKIYVDGETFPSHFGTGTEDYYGYAWCRPEFFCAPFHAQPEGGGNLAAGFSVNDRYRALDAIPFTKGLTFDMELWHWRDTRVTYAPATFWYARPGASWNVEPDAASAAAKVARQREDVLDGVRTEAEALKMVEKTGGQAEVQQVPAFIFSGGAQLWWKDATAGDRLVLEFPAANAGRYKVWAAMTKAPDYGIAALRVNGQPAGRFDRYHAEVACDVLPLGVFDLKEGPNRLAVEIAGANPKAAQRHMVGLDYLMLEPVPAAP